MAANPRKPEIIDGYTIKYHANGVTRWSKGKCENDIPEGYWEWYRIDGRLKRSGHFDAGEPVGGMDHLRQRWSALQGHP